MDLIESRIDEPTEVREAVYEELTLSISKLNPHNKLEKISKFKDAEINNRSVGALALRVRPRNKRGSTITFSTCNNTLGDLINNDT